MRFRARHLLTGFGRPVTVVCFLGVAVCAGFSQSRISPEALLERAVERHQDGNLSGAIADYQDLIELGYGNSSVLSNLGAAYAGLGQLQQAIDTYRKALGLRSNNVAVRLNLGLALYKTADFAGALEEFERVIRDEPGNRQARTLAANIYFGMGDNQAVIDKLSPLKAEAGEDPAIAYLLGTALIREGQLIEGQVYLDVVLRHPDSVQAHLMLATAHISAEAHDQAIEEIQKAISLNPDQAGSHSMLGQVRLLMNDVEGAKTAFAREVEINEHDFDANFHLGSLLKEESDYDRAMVYLEKASSLRPEALEVTFQIAAVEMARGNPEEARLMLERIVKREPGFIQAHASLAAAYHRLGMAEEADRQREIVVRLTAEKDAREPKTRRTLFGGGSAGDEPGP